MLRELFRFHGGVKPATNKTASTTSPIARAPIPARLVVPLHQSLGSPAIALVEPGQHVLKGERIGAAGGRLSAAIHAPTSGVVRAVEPALVPHASGLREPAVIIESDGEDRWAEPEHINYRITPPDEVRDFVRDAGVVGLGGAVFPTHQKMRPGSGGKTRTLVLNGAECEPFITCDDMLMRERADGIVSGAAILRHMLQAEEVLIGIEDNKPEAIAAMRQAVAAAGEHMEVVAVPTRYPAGGAKQLIRVLTGIEVPHGERSTDYGVQCFNVGTAYSVHEALELGRPLVSRIVTVAGNVERPGNYEVLIGTPMDELVRLCGPRADTRFLVMGGPMMGVRMPAFDVPVVKATNCVLAANDKLFPPAPPEQPCIRCTECAKACPVELQPFELYWFSRSKNFGKAQEYHLFDCIECGCCAYVCPSHIPLVDYYRFSKGEIWAREREKAAADQARERFEFRNYRQEREKAEKAAKLAAKAAETRARLAEAGTAEAPAAAGAPAAEDPKKALIAAALARAKAQKAEIQPQNTDHLSPQTQAEIAEIEARRKALEAASASPSTTPAAPAAEAAVVPDEPRS